jgi:hypothetical protein
MVRILDRHPHLTFDEARLRAHELLAKAAKRVNYQTPAVLTQEQEERQRLRLAGLKSTVNRVPRSGVSAQATGEAVDA